MGVAFINSRSPADAPDLMPAQSDRAMAKRAASGEREAFRCIVETHKRRMYSVAYSVVSDAVLAEDIVQDAFIKAYRALPEFRGDSQLSTWLHRITYLTAIDAQRQQTRYRQLTADLQHSDTDIADDEISQDDRSLHTSQLRRQINEALLTLSPFEQTVFALRHLQNFKLKEIAVVVDRSEGTVKNILFRAIHKLRVRLTHVATDIPETEFIEANITEPKTC